MGNVFNREWRECLEAHYKDVVRNNDKKTMPSLLTVMNEVGFREDELRELAVLATAHVDDVAEDFVPDLEILQSPAVETVPEVEEPAPPKPDRDAPQQLSLF